MLLLVYISGTELSNSSSRRSCALEVRSLPLAAFSLQFLLGHGSFECSCNSSLGFSLNFPGITRPDSGPSPFALCNNAQEHKGSELHGLRRAEHTSLELCHPKQNLVMELLVCLCPSSEPNAHQGLCKALLASACRIAPPVRKLVLKGLDASPEHVARGVRWFF